MDLGDGSSPDYAPRVPIHLKLIDQDRQVLGKLGEGGRVELHRMTASSAISVGGIPRALIARYQGITLTTCVAHLPAAIFAKSTD